MSKTTEATAKNIAKYFSELVYTYNDRSFIYGLKMLSYSTQFSALDKAFFILEIVMKRNEIKLDRHISDTFISGAPVPMSKLTGFKLDPDEKIMNRYARKK